MLPTIADLEAAFLTAWPAVMTVHDGRWLWRWANGYSKRGNSVQSQDPTDDADVAARLDRLMALSRHHGITPLFRVTPLAAPAIVAALDVGHWTTIEPSRVLSMDLAMAPAPTATNAVAVLAPTDPLWLAHQARLSGYDTATADRLARIVALIAVPAAGLLVHDAADEPVAAALVVQTGTIAIYLNVIVDSSRRGQGYGRHVMTAALAWATTHGARHAGIQVLADNAPAAALYRSLGFGDRYGYVYRRPTD